MTDESVRLIDLIATKIRGHDCKELQQQTGNEYVVKGPEVGITGFKVKTGDYENKIKEFYRVTDTMVALDRAQFLMCKTIHDKITSAELKDICNRINLQIIFGFTQLEVHLSAVARNPTEESKKRLEDWVNNMDMLSKNAIKAVHPPYLTGDVGEGMLFMGGFPPDEWYVERAEANKKIEQETHNAVKKDLDKIMQYQGIPKDEMDAALKLIS